MGQRQPLLSSFLKARLSRRIVTWIFLSIITIEAIILVPSVYRRERELLSHLRSLSAAQASGILEAQDLSQLSDQELLIYLQKIQHNPLVLGGTLYSQSGSPIGSFGQPPQLTAAQIQQAGRFDRYWRRQDRYDALWSMSPLEGRYQLVIRHDATQVRQEFFAFIARIVGLVLIISVFVTLATMVGLEQLLIQPIMRLRQDLLKAGQAIREDASPRVLPFESVASDRNDELGDVIAAFDQMFSQITDAIATRKASEVRFRTLVEQAADAFFVIDAAGTIIEVNQQACDSLGYSQAELLSLKVPDIQANFSQEDFRALWRTLKPGLSLNREGQHRRQDGTLFPVEVRASMLALGNQQVILALARDISHRKEAEAALARLAEIGELAAMIVHEVRNPLTTVVLGLKSFQSPDLPERSQIRLALALEESDRLQRLLSEILLYTRQQELDLAEVDLNQVVQELLPRLQALPVAAGRLITLQLAPHPVYVQADTDKLKQVLINLVTNACEAVVPEAKILWRVRQMTQTRAVIEIHNGGEPIPPAVLSRLTQPFFTTKPTGNGLGLAITRRIVEAHQGELRIRSSASEGTWVTVSLPTHLPPASSAQD